MEQEFNQGLFYRFLEMTPKSSELKKINEILHSLEDHAPKDAHIGIQFYKKRKKYKATLKLKTMKLNFYLECEGPELIEIVEELKDKSLNKLEKNNEKI